MLEVEYVIHVLWCCPGAQDVWGCGPVLFQKCPSFFSDFAELIAYLLSKLNDDLMCLSMLIFHRIWLRRNKLIFEGHFSHPLKVFSDASSLFDDFKRHNLREPLVLASSSVGSIFCKIWKPPTATSFKVNWDASLNINSELVGFGCVLRNEEGFVIAAKCCVCKALVDPVCAEVMATLVALDFCSDLDVSSIECEGDSLQIIKGVSSTDYSLDKIGHFLDAIKQKAASFLVCKWSHCFREANEVAHLLARRASLRCFSNVWVEDMPLFISSASFRDHMVSRL
jgi:ribonuclease HI